MTPKFIAEADPFTLEEHPVLQGLPALTEDQYQALKASIADKGVMVELRGVPTSEGGIAIYSGRHRRRAAMELGLTVPLLLNGIDPAKLAEFVIDEVTTGRQLTKSGLALLLFERHPALTETGKRKGGAGAHKKNQPAVERQVGEEGGNPSIAWVAERYKLSRDYFTLLGKIRHGQPAGEGALKLDPASAEAWAEIRRQIIEDETPLTRIWAGWNGKVSTAGKKAPTDYAATCRSGLISLREAFQRWKQVPMGKRTELIALWQELQTLIPEDLQ